jgi:hypothetical protein
MMIDVCGGNRHDTAESGGNRRDSDTCGRGYCLFQEASLNLGTKED